MNTNFIGLRNSLGTLLFSALLLTSHVSIADVIDQSNEPSSVLGTQFNQRETAQTFVVGRSGKLVQVDLKLSQLAPTGNLIVSIFALPGGIGSEERVLKSSTSVPVSTLPSNMLGGAGPQYVSFYPTPQVNVSPGDVLAIVAHKDTGGTGGAYGIFWLYGGDDYPAGSAMRYDPGSIQACPAFGDACPPPVTEPSWLEFQVSVAEQGVQTRDFAFRTFVAESAVPASGPIAQLLIVLAIAGSAATVLASSCCRV